MNSFSHTPLPFFLTFLFVFISHVSWNQMTVSIHDIQGEAAGSPYSGEIVSTSGIVTASDVTSADWGNIGFFIQDGEGAWNGIFIYTPDYNPTMGDEVTVTGTVAEYYSNTEMSDVTAVEVISTDNPLPEATALSTGEVASSEAYEGCLVSVTSAECISADEGFGDALFDDGSGGLTSDDAMYFPVDGWVAGEVYAITGVINYHYDLYKIEPRNASDISIANDVLTNVRLQPELRAVPNPTTSTVAFSSAPEGAIRVFDATGRVILEQVHAGGDLKLNLRDWPQGVYTVAITGAHGLVQTQVLKR
jgi:hypothetical protein